MQKKKRLSIEDKFAIVGFLLVITIWWCWGTWGADTMRGKIERSIGNKSAVGINASPDKSLEPPLPMPLATESVDRFQQLGQTGDLFGGVNALFAAIAVVGVFYAGALQRRTMLESRRAISRQQFETVFFELLRLTREVSQDIQFRGKKSDPQKSNEKSEIAKYGAQALNALAYFYFNNSPSVGVNASIDAKVFALKTMVKIYKAQVFQAQPSTLGPYWRLLYQMFLLVDNAPLEEAEKIRFANIVRGQISEGAVLLLALNGIHWRGHKFVMLIEKYGLLEHMHARYREKHGAVLLMAYRRHAFMGSDLRSRTPWGPAPVPGPEGIDVQPSGIEAIEESFSYEDELRGIEKIS